MKTKTMESVNLHITPLSPVHVGIGEDYEPTNYVMEEGTLFAFDSDVASRVLTERQRKDLLNMVSKPTHRPEDLIKQVQDFFHNNRKPLAAASSHFLPVSAGVFALYQKRVGQSANRESGGKSVVNKLEIQRTFFNPYSQQPVIPGSSIKGAIRTALLDDV
ncbi:MAG: RAMP superfamily CRISPR-associated protein, partial [Thiothrix sp.]